ncbi:hypothetical protein Hte_011437 [Hypoxylon texense]
MKPINFISGFAVTALLTLPYQVTASVDECGGVLSSDALPVLVDPSAILKHLQAIQDHADKGNGSRVAGSYGHNLTIGYIQDHLRSEGYYVEVQRFQGLMQIRSEANLIVGGQSIRAEPVAWSPNYTAEFIPIVPVNGPGCRAECGDEDNTLMVGTHTDSADSSAGINDNGSGIAALLEVASQLTKFKTNSKVKFAFWTASEPCQLGSRHWFDTTYTEERNKIRLYLDVNMIGSPNAALKVYDGNGTYFHNPGPSGSGMAEAVLADGFKIQGVSIKRAEISNRSDYAPFFEHQIPFAGLFSGADGIKTKEEFNIFGGEPDRPYDHNYHQAGDDLENINTTALLLNTKALAHAVGVYGRGFDGFPMKTRLGAGSRYAEPMKYSGVVGLAWVVYWLLSNTL